jgi:catechol 2,3-dioxygenase-like lactoylglutathione lyase family enzyme
MPVVRYLVNNVDESLPFYKILGFKLADRWGPPFAIVKRKSLSVWLSGPGTSARRKLKNGSTPEPGGWNRLVLEVKDIEATVAELSALGAKFRGKPIKGPGGKQVLVEDPSGNVMPNPSVKGTSTSGLRPLAAAPYLER